MENLKNDEVKISNTRGVIISRFNEDISWVGQLKGQFDLFLYNKSSDQLDFDSIMIPNIGREAETFLRHIIENYHNLNEIMIFCQGCPFHHCKNFISQSNQETESIIPLSDWIPHVNHYSSIDMINKGNMILSKFGLRNLSNTSTFSAGAQYIVNRKLILRKPQSWWSELYKELLSNVDGPDSNPWIFERIWPIIFGNDLDFSGTSLPSDYGKI